MESFSEVTQMREGPLEPVPLVSNVLVCVCVYMHGYSIVSDSL